MLIKVSHKGTSFYGSRHSPRMKREDEDRYRLRQGIAKFAIRSRVTGLPEVDAVGRPLKYCNEMEERHSLHTLTQWAKGRSTMAVIGGGNTRRVPWPWEIHA